MRDISKLFAMSTLLALYSSVQAHESCIKNSIGQPVCPPANGGIAKNSIGQVLCGYGQCIKNSIGQVVCSNQLGGFATTNSIGQVVCTGGCAQGSQYKCEKPY